jgi:hypothetical protein
MNMKKSKIGLVGFLIILAVLQTMSVSAQQTASAPIPSGAQIVLWMRANQVAQDPDLRATLLNNNAVARYIGLLNMDLAQIDRVVLFMPFDKAWINNNRLVIPQTLPQSGALIVTGSFNAKSKYQEFKSNGWKEIDYSNKKLLWWSTGTKFLSNPKGAECVGQLPDGSLAVGGSQQIMRGILDVAGGKAQGLQATDVSNQLSQDFASDNSKLASLYISVTPEMRSVIKADTIAIKSSTGRAAIDYVDHLDEFGLAMRMSAGSFLASGYLGMDSESNSLIVASIFQIGGGLASLLPPNDPNRAALESLDVSRSGKTVILQSNMTKQQLLGLMRHK